MVAIIIPYFKINFFETTLQSLAEQTELRFKVYIGDDASPEDPSALLKKYQGTFDFTYHRFEQNLGSISLVKQWERCIALTQDEEWLMILGDDDVLGINVVENFYASKNEFESLSVVRFASSKIDEKGTQTSIIYQHPTTETSVEFLFRGVRSSLSEYIFRKEKILSIGFKDFPLAWFSDVLAVLEFSDFKSVFSINDALVYVRISNLNISGRQDNLKLKVKAYFCFYLYLLNQRANHFTIIQKKELLYRISKSFLYNKKQISLFFKISKIYILNFFIIDYLKFIKSIGSNILNNKCE